MGHLEHKAQSPAVANCFIVTISDTRTEATDTSGRAIFDLLWAGGHQVAGRRIVRALGLSPATQRYHLGFMGCYAAINALKLARHIVRSEPSARVLIVNVELCTLHLKETTDIEQVLSFLLFGDGCAACLVSADPIGTALDSFRAVLVPDTRELITWNIRDYGFDMVLSGQVPATIQAALHNHMGEILDGASAGAIDLWAVHPGGRTVLDAVEQAFGLAPPALMASREVLRRYGNMSSATVMFVIEKLMRSGAPGTTARRWSPRTRSPRRRCGTRRRRGTVPLPGPSVPPCRTAPIASSSSSRSASGR